MDYKQLVADIIVYSINRIELAEFDLNVTMEEFFEGELNALSKLLQHLEVLLGGQADDELNHCMKLVREVMEEYNERKGDKHLD